MIVLSLNKILNWCQITTGGKTHNCPTKVIDNVLCFKFKDQWHKVADYASEYAEELIEENGKIISKKFLK